MGWNGARGKDWLKAQGHHLCLNFLVLFDLPLLAFPIEVCTLFSQGLAEHLKDQGQWYDSVLALEPTGWTHNKKFRSLSELKPKMKRDRITLYGKAKHKVETG